MSSSVVQEWVLALPWRMQSVVLLGLRGCDGVAKDDPSKAISRGLRGLVFHNADPSNTFILDVDPAKVQQYLWDLDRYPMHFVMHSAHAAEIAGYHHPDTGFRTYWLDFYKKVCLGLHLNFETKQQLDVRLGTTPHEQATRVAMKSTAEQAFDAAVDKAVEEQKHQWEAGTGTSHGSRKSRTGTNWKGGS
jgi:hypothetical protein